MPLRPSSTSVRTPSAQAASVPASAVPMLIPQGKHLGKAGMTLTRSFTLIGSRQRAHLHLVSESISKAHAFIVNTDTGLYIRDLASRTHVVVNGKSVVEADLHDGDLVTLGSFTFKFTDASGKRLLGKPAAAPPATLDVEGQLESFPFKGRVLLIGRRKTCDISLSGNDISTAHAVIFEMNGNRFIRDLGSRTGTFVNDVQVNGHKHALKFGDVIRVGDVTFKFTSAEVAETADSLDELEDLVGTARIGMDHAEPELPPKRPAAPPEPARAARPAAPSTNSGRVPMPAARQEIDLDAESTEPDLAEPAEETVAMPSTPAPPVIPPALSRQVVDDAEDVGPLAVEPEPPAIPLVADGNRGSLHHEPSDIDEVIPFGETIPLAEGAPGEEAHAVEDAIPVDEPLPAEDVLPLAEAPEEHSVTTALPPIPVEAMHPGTDAGEAPLDEFQWATSEAGRETTDTASPEPTLEELADAAEQPGSDLEAFAVEEWGLPADHAAHEPGVTAAIESSEEPRDAVDSGHQTDHAPEHAQASPAPEHETGEPDLSDELGLSPNVVGFMPASHAGEAHAASASHLELPPHEEVSEHADSATEGERLEPSEGVSTPAVLGPSYGLEFLDESAKDAEALDLPTELALPPESPVVDATLVAPPPTAPPTIAPATPPPAAEPPKKKSWFSGLFGKSQKTEAAASEPPVAPPALAPLPPAHEAVPPAQGGAELGEPPISEITSPAETGEASSVEPLDELDFSILDETPAEPLDPSAEGHGDESPAAEPSLDTESHFESTWSNEAEPLAIDDFAAPLEAMPAEHGEAPAAAIAFNSISTGEAESPPIDELAAPETPPVEQSETSAVALAPESDPANVAAPLQIDEFAAPLETLPTGQGETHEAAFAPESAAPHEAGPPLIDELAAPLEAPPVEPSETRAMVFSPELAASDGGEPLPIEEFAAPLETPPLDQSETPSAASAAESSATGEAHPIEELALPLEAPPVEQSETPAMAFGHESAATSEAEPPPIDELAAPLEAPSVEQSESPAMVVAPEPAAPGGAEPLPIDELAAPLEILPPEQAEMPAAVFASEPAATTEVEPLAVDEFAAPLETLPAGHESEAPLEAAAAEDAGDLSWLDAELPAQGHAGEAAAPDINHALEGSAGGQLSEPAALQETPAGGSSGAHADRPIDELADEILSSHELESNGVEDLPADFFSEEINAEPETAVAGPVSYEGHEGHEEEKSPVADTIGVTFAAPIEPVTADLPEEQPLEAPEGTPVEGHSTQPVTDAGIFATAEIPEAGVVENLAGDVPAPAAEHAAEAHAAPPPSDPYAFPEVLSPEKDISDAVFDFDMPAEDVTPRVEATSLPGPGSSEMAHAEADPEMSAAEAFVLEGDILDPEVVEPEFGESRPYQPQFVDSEVIAARSEPMVIADEVASVPVEPEASVDPIPATVLPEQVETVEATGHPAESVEARLNQDEPHGIDYAALAEESLASLLPPEEPAPISHAAPSPVSEQLPGQVAGVGIEHEVISPPIDFTEPTSDQAEHAGLPEQTVEQDAQREHVAHAGEMPASMLPTEESAAVGQDTISLIRGEMPDQATVSNQAGTWSFPQPTVELHAEPADGLPEATPEPMEAEPTAEVHGELVPPLPFDAGDVLASEPLVPLTPESEHPAAPEETLPADFLQEQPEEIDDLLNWPEVSDLAMEPAPVEPAEVAPPATETTEPATAEEIATSVAAAETPAPEAAPAEPTPVELAAPPQPQAAASQSQAAFNPMFGMGRDMASFIGGMPLSLPELPKPRHPFSQVAVTFDGQHGMAEQPLVASLDALSSQGPAIDAPITYSSEIVPPQEPATQGTLEGWGELPGLIDPDHFEELNEIEAEASDETALKRGAQQSAMEPTHDVEILHGAAAEEPSETRDHQPSIDLPQEPGTPQESEAAEPSEHLYTDDASGNASELEETGLEELPDPDAADRGAAEIEALELEPATEPLVPLEPDELHEHHEAFAPAEAESVERPATDVTVVEALPSEGVTEALPSEPSLEEPAMFVPTADESLPQDLTEQPAPLDAALESGVEASVEPHDQSLHIEAIEPEESPLDQLAEVAEVELTAEPDLQPQDEHAVEFDPFAGHSAESQAMAPEQPTEAQHLREGERSADLLHAVELDHAGTEPAATLEIPLELETPSEQEHALPATIEATPSAREEDRAEELIVESLASQAPAVMPQPAAPAKPTGIRPPAKTAPKKIVKAGRTSSTAAGAKAPVISGTAARRPAASRTSSFDNMGLPPAGTDPFSGAAGGDMAASIPADSAFGGAMGSLSDIPPSNGARRKPAAPPVGAPRPGSRVTPAAAGVKNRAPGAPGQSGRPAAVSPKAAAAPRTIKPTAAAAPPPMSRADADQPTADELPPQAAPRKGRRRLILLVLVLLLTAAAVAAVLTWHFKNQSVKGSLLFDGNMTVAQRGELLDRQRRLLDDWNFRALARKAAADSSASPRRLNDATFAALSRSAAWDEKGTQITLMKGGADGADKPAVAAVLHALYECNRPPRDEADRLHEAYADAIHAAADLPYQLESLDRAIHHDTDLASNADKAKTAAAILKEKLDVLARDRNAADARIRALEAEIKPLEPTVSVTEAPTTAPTTAPALAGLNPENDEQVKQLRSELERVNTNLKDAKDARDAQATRAAELLETAQKQFDAQIQAARQAAGSDSAIGKLLAGAKQFQDSIHQLNDEVVQEQKDQRQSLDRLKQDLAEANAARLKQIWDADSGPNSLQDYQQRLAVAERRLNTAVAAKLSAAAAVEKANMDRLNAEIKARQDLLASKDLYNPVVKRLQDAMDHIVQSLENDRAKNEARVQEVLQTFEKAKPQTEQLPVEQQALAKQLDESSKALQDAREQYNRTQKEITAKSDKMVQDLASQVAAQQAKIDDRKKQLVAIAALTPTPDRLAQLAAAREQGIKDEYRRKRGELDEARSTQSELESKYEAAAQRLGVLQANAQSGAEAADRLKQETADREALAARTHDADDRRQEAAARLQNVIEPRKPDGASVTLEGEDPRLEYLLWVLGGGFCLTILTGIPVVLARHSHSQPMAEEAGWPEPAGEEYLEAVDAYEPYESNGEEDSEAEEAYEEEADEEEEYPDADPVLSPVHAVVAVQAAAVGG